MSTGAVNKAGGQPSCFAQGLKEYSVVKQGQKRERTKTEKGN
jgi:hypothetical protein